MKILYGVPGEGMGHATRTKVIVHHLLKNHEVRIISSGKAYTFLKAQFGERVHLIEGLNFIHKEGGISRSRTAFDFITKSSDKLYKNFHKYIELHKTFKPNLVISDFESFSTVFSKINRIPLLSIDNIQVINRCKLDISIPLHQKSNFKIAQQIVKAKVPQANKYLISAFFNPLPLKSNTLIIPPIIRQEIVNTTRERGNHFLVYQNSLSARQLLPILEQLPGETFYVYGAGVRESHHNVEFFPFNEKEFINHLAQAKAILTNGGYSLISEAVYLGKPILSIPLTNQFEQYLNAAYIEKLMYGRNFENFSSDNIKAFLYDLPLFTQRVSQYQQSGNSITLQEIDRVIREIAPQKPK